MNTKEQINARTAGPACARGGNVTGDNAASRDGRKHLALLMLLCQAPLCLCFAATAVVLQWAEVMRSRAITDDALLPSLMQYVPPAAFVFLVAGFALSIGITAASIWFAAAGSSRFCGLSGSRFCGLSGSRFCGQDATRFCEHDSTGFCEKDSSSLCETEACACSDGR